ncbi:MAG: hypothetical protein H6933_12090 [Burkholderiaceae bacterium]|nr:hypothetical protein [Rhodoferax sp.]MCP5285629.1 hypothetical protein [Burkholderiaceae bacterium]
MYLIAIAWMYVVLMMAVAEALSPQGTVIGAVMTLVLYGVGPLALLLYILGTPLRRRQRRAAEAQELQEGQAQATQVTERDEAVDDAAAGSGVAPDGGGQPPGDAVAPVGKEA